MDSRNPLLLVRSGKQESNAFPLYNRSALRSARHMVNTSSSIDSDSIFGPSTRSIFRPERAPTWCAARLECCCATPCPRSTPGSSNRAPGPAPSGLADWPRPFVLPGRILTGHRSAGRPLLSRRSRLRPPSARAGTLSCRILRRGKRPRTGPGTRQLERTEQLDLAGVRASGRRGSGLVPRLVWSTWIRNRGRGSVTVRFESPTS